MPVLRDSSTASRSASAVRTGPSLAIARPRSTGEGAPGGQRAPRRDSQVDLAGPASATRRAAGRIHHVELPRSRPRDRCTVDERRPLPRVVVLRHRAAPTSCVDAPPGARAPERLDDPREVGDLPGGAADEQAVDLRDGRVGRHRLARDAAAIDDARQGRALGAVELLEPGPQATMHGATCSPLALVPWVPMAQPGS
ncbi:MAG: hypothetical protein U0802_22600 [Candidatus Binatia bacterium]